MMAARTESLPIEPLLDVHDVMAICKVSRATVYGWVKSGVLKPINLPVRKTRFRRSDVLEFIGDANEKEVTR